MEADLLKTRHKSYKWKNFSSDLEQGELAVVMDHLLPPSEWRLGRIENTYTGADDNGRVADIRTTTGLIKRPIVKLCYLTLLNKK